MLLCFCFFGGYLGLIDRFDFLVDKVEALRAGTYQIDLIQDRAHEAFFFALLCDIPLKECIGGMVAFLDGQGYQCIDRFCHPFFVGQGFRKDGLYVFKIRWGLFDRRADGHSIHLEEIMKDLHHMHMLFGGLTVHEGGASLQGFIFKPAGLGEIEKRGIAFKSDLLIEGGDHFVT